MTIYDREYVCDECLKQWESCSEEPMTFCPYCQSDEERGELMTRQDLIDLMESDVAIGIKDFMALHDQYITSMLTHTQGYAHNQLEYIAAYVKFLEDHFMEDL